MKIKQIENKWVVKPDKKCVLVDAKTGARYDTVEYEYEPVIEDVLFNFIEVRR